MHNKRGLIAGQIVVIVLLAVASAVAILQLTGTINILGNLSDLCPDKGDKVLCGICNKDIKLSDNPYAGQCRLCPSSTTCSGDVCGEMKCIPNNKGETRLLVITLMGNKSGTVQKINSRAVPDAAAAPDVVLDADVNVPITYSFSPEGVTTDYSVALYSGYLPSGMFLNANGILGGKPNEAGTSNFVVCVEYRNENPRSCSVVAFTVKPAEPPPGSGCCEPACLVTEKDKCPEDLGFTFHNKSCDSVAQCKKGCCTPVCVTDRKQNCEDTGFTFHNESCNELAQCKPGCCMPACITKTQEMCEISGLTFRNESCDELPQCKKGCCTPMCVMEAQAACEFVGIENIQRGVFHDESCDKIASCKRPGRWEGTYTSHNVFNGIWTCIGDTTAKISICMEQQGQNLAGVITFPDGFKETITSPEPDAVCPGGVHCSGGPGGQCSELAGHFDSNGKFSLTALTLDGGGYVYNPYFPSEKVQSSAVVVGNSMTVNFSSSGSSGRDITSSTTGTFYAEKVSDDCNT